MEQPRLSILPSLIPLLLLLLLLPAFPALDPDEGPILSGLHVDPVLRRLYWDLRGQASGLKCTQHTKTLQEVWDNGNQYCEFFTLSHCRPTRFSVVVQDLGLNASVIFPTPAWSEAQRPQNLRCWIHDVERLSCSWTPGPQAPGDLDYKLSWRDGSRSGPLSPCGSYEVDAHSLLTSCVLAAFPTFPDSIHVLVAAADKEPALCDDDHFMTASLEEVLAVPELSCVCNANKTELSWAPPSRFTESLRYQLRTWRDLASAQDFHEHDLHNTNSYVTWERGPFWAQLRVRRHVVAGMNWTAWGPARSFDCFPDSKPRLWAFTIASTLGAVLGTLGVALVVLLLGRKFCPRIPGLKDPTRGVGLPNLDLMPLEDDPPLTPLQVLSEAA